MWVGVGGYDLFLVGCGAVGGCNFFGCLWVGVGDSAVDNYPNTLYKSFNLFSLFLLQNLCYC